MLLRLAFLTVLVGAAGCSAPAAERPATSGTPAATALSVSVADFMIEPPELRVQGGAVSIAVTNDGRTPHNFTVRNAAGDVLMATSDLSAGASETVSAELDPGEYTIFCSLAGHESLGMSGSLTVTP
jgi:plastocyanin